MAIGGTQCRGRRPLGSNQVPSRPPTGSAAAKPRQRPANTPARSSCEYCQEGGVFPRMGAASVAVSTRREFVAGKHKPRLSANAPVSGLGLDILRQILALGMPPRRGCAAPFAYIKRISTESTSRKKKCKLRERRAEEMHTTISNATTPQRALSAVYASTKKKHTKTERMKAS